MGRRLLAWFRAARGYCPRCNSDAPMLDTCNVCCSWSTRRRPIFPPQWWERAIFMLRWEAWQGLLIRGDVRETGVDRLNIELIRFARPEDMRAALDRIWLSVDEEDHA